MSYKASARMTPIFCLLRLNSDATLSAGDAVPVIVDSGTSGHGVTVASGVVTLPSAYQWFAQTQIVPTSIISVDFDWYVGSTASTTFAQTGVSLVNSTTSGSNNIGYAYFDVAMSTKNIELRASVACTVDASFTWLMLTGYPS